MTVLDVFSKTTMVVSALNLFVSIPIYIFVIVTIAVNKKKYPFNSPFFTIFIALGIMDIACFVDYLGAKTPFWGFFPSLFQPYEAPSMLAKVNNFFIWFT
uniref:Uncharacterized protein n=1 Tax=Plectus sambesii TaxID=2011161 RepID=A0A914WSH9_9BILA